MTNKVTVKNEDTGHSARSLNVYVISISPGEITEPLLIGSLLPGQSQEFLLHPSQQITLDRVD